MSLMLYWLVCVVCFANVIVGAAAFNGTFRNPVIVGDNPDPSIVRVPLSTTRDIFYASSTSSQFEPVFEIFASADLVNWQSVDHVFQSQPQWADGAYWAPELFFDNNGTLYVFYTAHKSGKGPLCVAVATSSSLVPPFAFVDHGPLVCQSDGSIDASAVRDVASGALYLVWKEDSNSVGRATSIFAQQLDTRSFQLLGAPIVLLSNDQSSWEGTLVEGPFIMFRNGYYYLFYSGSYCCGRGCNYALGVARSQSLTAQFDKLDTPLVASNSVFLCPGHGTVVALRDGRDFLLHHAYVAANFTVGRQAVLSALLWDDVSGWPSVNGGAGVALRGAAPLPQKPPSGAGNKYRFRDDFASATTLRNSWSWPIDVGGGAAPNASLVASSLVLEPRTQPSADELAAVLCQRSRSASYNASTVVDLGATSARAALVVFGDAHNSVGIDVALTTNSSSGGNNAIEARVWRRLSSPTHEVLWSHMQPVVSAQLVVRLSLEVMDGIIYRFALDGSPIGFTVNGDFIAPWDRGVRIALACGGMSAPAMQCRFLEIDMM